MVNIFQIKYPIYFSKLVFPLVKMVWTPPRNSTTFSRQSLPVFSGQLPVNKQDSSLHPFFIKILSFMDNFMGIQDYKWSRNKWSSSIQTLQHKMVGQIPDRQNYWQKCFAMVWQKSKIQQQRNKAKHCSISSSKIKCQYITSTSKNKRWIQTDNEADSCISWFRRWTRSRTRWSKLRFNSISQSGIRQWRWLFWNISSNFKNEMMTVSKSQKLHRQHHCIIKSKSQK